MKSMYDKLKKKLQKYGNVDNEQLWTEIQKKTHPIFLKKNEVLINHGSRHRSVYFITTGSFVKFFLTEDGDKKAFWFHTNEVFPIAICGDSYFFNEATKYEIRALEDAHVIKINKEDIDLWILKYPTFNQCYIQDIIKDFMSITEIRAYTLAHSTEQVYNYITEKYPLIIQRVPSKFMAHFLGISPEWYSKLKKRMEA